MARVVIENLSKTFTSPKQETHAVRGVNLTIEDKELMVLVGPSGCGKSTLLRLIAGLEESSSGAIHIDGARMNEVAPKDRDIAMVFQHYALYPHMTAYDNIAFGLGLRRYSKKEIEERVGETAELLGLSAVLNRVPTALSGGERQRVALGRAMVRRPKVFLLDEPLSNLDAQMRGQMRREIAKLHVRLASTMIYVTHDQVEAMTLGDRVAVMKEGEIQQVADPMTLYRNPQNVFVGGFVGSPSMNFFPGQLRRGIDALYFQEEVCDSQVQGLRLRIEPEMAARLERFVDQSVVLGLRPEHISVTGCQEQSLASGLATNRTFEAVVELIETLGFEIHLSLTTGTRSFIARAPADYRGSVNERAAVSFDMSKASFFNSKTELSLV